MSGNVYSVINRRIPCFDVGNGICFNRQDCRKYFLKIVHAQAWIKIFFPNEEEVEENIWENMLCMKQ